MLRVHCWWVEWGGFPKCGWHRLQQDRQTTQGWDVKCSPSAWHKSPLLNTAEIEVKQSFSIPSNTHIRYPDFFQHGYQWGLSWTSSFPSGCSGLRIRDLHRISKLYSTLVLIILYNNNYNYIIVNNYYLYNRGRFFLRCTYEIAVVH